MNARERLAERIAPHRSLPFLDHGWFSWKAGWTVGRVAVFVASGSGAMAEGAATAIRLGS